MNNKISSLYHRIKTIAIVVVGITIASLLIVLLLNREDNTAHSQESQVPQNNSEAVNPCKDADLTVEIIPAPNDTWGYNIEMNGRTLIRQPNVPALPGVEGFRTEEEARIVGKFVIKKINDNIFPPSVTIEELDSLEVL